MYKMFKVDPAAFRLAAHDPSLFKFLKKKKDYEKYKLE